MSENKLVFVKDPTAQSQVEVQQRIEPSTCTEAETFVLQVLDDSMEPEFKQGCMIVIDPTGHAKEGSYVFAQLPQSAAQNTSELLVDQYQFRQLNLVADEQWQLSALNNDYPSRNTPSDFSEIVGVIVQRAGTRRRYHKRYD